MARNMKEKNKALEDEIESSGVSKGQDLDPELKEKIVQRKKEISGGGATRVKLMESPKPVGLQDARWRKPGVQEKTGGRWGSKPLAEAGGDGGRRSQESLAETLRE
nr:hypothetical protein CFP56_67182 [Quercus suber]